MTIAAYPLAPPNKALLSNPHNPVALQILWLIGTSFLFCFLQTLRIIQTQLTLNSIFITHLLSIKLLRFQWENCIKWFLGSMGKGPTLLTHLKASHHKFLVILHENMMWPISSSSLSHNGHLYEGKVMCLFLKLALVGNLFLKILQQKAICFFRKISQ